MELQKMNKWSVYILLCSDNTLYTGITNNISRRLKNHESGTGARYTKGRGPLTLVYVEECDNRAQASIREYKIKRMSRLEKEKLFKKPY